MMIDSKMSNRWTTTARYKLMKMKKPKATKKTTKEAWKMTSILTSLRWKSNQCLTPGIRSGPPTVRFRYKLMIVAAKRCRMSFPPSDNLLRQKLAISCHKARKTWPSRWLMGMIKIRTRSEQSWNYVREGEESRSVPTSQHCILSSEMGSKPLVQLYRKKTKIRQSKLNEIHFNKAKWTEITF